MSMQDPLADMLTRIRNALAVEKKEVSAPPSKIKIAVAEVMQQEGYINRYELSEIKGKPALRISLKYRQDRPAIEMIKRISRPGLRVYRKNKELPKVYNGLGVAIVSTPGGVMTDRAARNAGLGGEILCYIY